MTSTPIRHNSSGFTLIELAVAMTVIAILGASVLMAVRVQMVQRQTSETRAALEEAREALLAFAAANGHLPCPSLGGAPDQGQENRDPNTKACKSRRGLLPWSDLGIVAIDGYGRRLAYATGNEVSDASPPITLDTSVAATKLSVQGGQALGTRIASDGAAVAAIWSFGPNGLFGTTADGNTIDGSATAGADETTNGTNSASVVISRPISENAGAPGGAFDDEVIWISRYVLFNRMITAGKLP
ncbi:type II secretion system protein [Niveibacterium microcysteis]|uniref:Type II secretion system protein n=1 Tax=Niveibacterium microcysteis TaxID=2811415 RepID=A0ABX7M831_9RHOO|nr:type II secretion system protein [Niveibacterium microcysteis]QSI77902.1 type II secretion system protein [Niveibacterium microcysteis]